MPSPPPSPPGPTDSLPNLTAGVPGVQWKSAADRRPDAGNPDARLPEQPQESYRLYVGLLMGIALVLRLLVAMMGPFGEIENAYTEHTAQQLALADNLVEHRTFGLEAQPPGSIADDLDTLRAERGELTTVGSTGLLKRKMPATLAAAIVALHPALIVAPSALDGGVIVTLLVGVGLLAVVAAKKRGFSTAFGGGLGLGLAALFAPVLAWLAPLTGTWMVLSERRLCGFALAAVMLAGAALPIGGWIYRNVGHGLEPWVAASPTVDRLFGTVVLAESDTARPFDREATGMLMGQLRQQLNLPAQADTPVLRYADQLGMQRLNANRGGHLDAIGRGAATLALDHSLDEAYARLGIDYIPDGAAAAWLGEDTAAAPEEAVSGWIVNAWVGLNGALLVVMAVGAGLMLWRGHFAALLLVATVVGFYAYISPAGTDETMRLPLIGLQAIPLAAIFVPGPMKARKAKKKTGPRQSRQTENHAFTGSPLAGPITEPNETTVTPNHAASPTDRGSTHDAIHPALRGTTSDVDGDEADTPPLVGAGRPPF